MIEIHEQLRDRMPDVLRGTAAWTAEETAHLAACAECREELTMLSAALRIGAGVERRFDPMPVAAAVAERLRREPARVVARYRPLMLLATAAALALFLARPSAAPVPSRTPVEVAGIFPELDSLSAEELAVLDSLSEIPLSDAFVPGTLPSDADTVPMRQILNSLEG